MAVKLRIQDIMAEAREISFLEPEAEINRLLGLGATREYRLEGPVGVVLAHYRAGTELFLAGEDLHPRGSLSKAFQLRQVRMQVERPNPFEEPEAIGRLIDLNRRR